MLDRLKVVYGAVEERALLSALSHICIYNGRSQATNSRMAIDAPMPELEGINAAVPANRFLAAIEASAADARVTMDGNRLTIVSGRFRAKVPVLPAEDFPRADPDPPQWELEDYLLPTLKRLRPFVASDATNIWATSILFTQNLAVATINTAIAYEPCTMLAGTGVMTIAVPGWAIDEILRMGQEPSLFGVSDNSITFYFDDIWIKTQLIKAPWPLETVDKIVASIPKRLPEVPEDLALAVEKITPFCRDPKFPVILMQADGVTTEDFDHQAEVRGLDDLPTLRFDARPLNLVLSKADKFKGLDETRAAFAIGPARGVIMGLRG